MLGGVPTVILLSRQCQRLKKDFPEYTFIEVDRDENIDLAAELNIFGIPSFVVYSDGKEIGRFVNKDRKTKQQVEDFLNDLK